MKMEIVSDVCASEGIRTVQKTFLNFSSPARVEGECLTGPGGGEAGPGSEDRPPCWRPAAVLARPPRAPSASATARNQMSVQCEARGTFIQIQQRNLHKVLSVTI